MYERILNAVSTSVQKNKDGLTLFLKEKVGPITLQLMMEESVQRLILSRIHGTLPLPARIFMGEDKFVGFFMNNKKLALRLLSPLVDGMQEGTTSSLPAGDGLDECVSQVIGAEMDNCAVDGALLYELQEADQPSSR